MNIDKKDTNKIDSNGLKQGFWRIYHHNNKLWYEVNFVNGKAHGSTKYWLDNGALRWEVYYVNEIQEGEEVKYEY